MSKILLVLLIAWCIPLMAAPSTASEARVVRVGVNDYQPLVFHGENGELRGFFIDILTDVAKTEGWRIEYVSGTFQEALQRLKNGEVDLVTGLSQTGERKVSYDFCVEPVVSTWAQIYTRKNTRISSVLDLEKKRIAYLRGDILANQFWVLANQFGFRAIYLGQDTVEQLFEAVRSGQADACICERIGGEIYKAKYSLVKSPILYFPSSLYFAAPKGRNADLLAALDRYLRAERGDPFSRYNSMVSHWLEEESQPRIPEYLNWILRGSLAVLLLAALAAGLLWAHNRRLALMVRERTAELSTINREMNAILDNISSFIGLLSPDGTVVAVNRSALVFSGVSLEEVAQKPFWETPWWAHSPEAQRLLREAVAAAARGIHARFETEHYSPAGEIRHIDFSLTPIRDDSGRVTLLIPQGYDITERKRAAEALLAEKERLAVTLRSIGDGVITTDREGRVALMNRVAEKLTGWNQEEAAGCSLEEVFHTVSENTRQRLPNPAVRVLESGGVIELPSDTILLARDGRELAIADSGAPIRDAESAVVGMVVVFRDITEKRRMEGEAHRMEKLEAVGILAGGIAHDFNNILTGIMGALSMARMILETAHPAAEMLRAAEEQSLRARDLTGQLLTFSRGGDPVRVAASVEATVRETVSFVLRGSPVKGNFRFPADLRPARVDLNQIGRVIHNLTLNALQAMPEGGALEVSADNIAIGERDPLPLAPGEYIRLTVRDTGTGILPEHLSRIFDPYFTTKKTGSGLGLAATFSIVKRHEGYISVKSEMGQGTVFQVYLPAADAPVERRANAPGLIWGSGRVLVMDDEESVRKVVTQMAGLLGYTVESVDEGGRAVQRYREVADQGERFDAVIMDMTVPGGMGGEEAAALIRAFDPEARIIVSSGYSISPIMGEYSSHGFSGVLRKPFRMEEIGAALHEATEMRGKEPEAGG